MPLSPLPPLPLSLLSPVGLSLLTPSPFLCLLLCMILQNEASGPEELLQAWLKAAEAAYNDRFHMAVSRQYRGLTYKEEADWQGSYFFIQLADPQANHRL